MDKDKYEVGEVVQISYKTTGNFILNHFILDGEILSNDSFVMPNKDVVLSGDFVDAIKNRNVLVHAEAAGIDGKSYWNFAYEETCFHIYVQVIDRYITGKEWYSTALSDNVECIISKANDCDGLEPYSTVKFLVSCDNDYFLQRAVNSDTFGPEYTVDEGAFVSFVTIKNYDNDGYDGYDVDIYFSYALLGLNREQSIGNLSVCPSYRNSNHWEKTEWSSFKSDSINFLKTGEHPIVLADGNLEYR